MDRRQKKTRFAIFGAFTDLLSVKGYNQISVQEIIDAANVGRTTFYAHFETKEYLLRELCAELFDHILEAQIGHNDEHKHYFDCDAPDSVFLHLIGHLQKNDNHILDLLSSQNNDIFKNYFKQNLKTLIRSLGARHDKSLPEDYIVNYVSGVFVDTVDWWLATKMKHTPEQITDYFLTVIEPVFKLNK